MLQKFSTILYKIYKIMSMLRQVKLKLLPPTLLETLGQREVSVLDFLSALWTAVVSICGGIGAIAAAWKIIKPSLTKPITDLTESVTKLAQESKQADKQIQQSLSEIDQQVSTMQHQKMMWAYSYYGINKHPITVQSKASLQQMYDQYVKGGKHNHIPQDFKKKIQSAPMAK